MYAVHTSSIILSVSFICVIWHSFCSCKMTKRNLNREKTQYQQSLIEVNVLGDVSSPGIYLHLPGVTVKEVISTAGLETKVNSKMVNVNQKIFSTSVVRVSGAIVHVDAVKDSSLVW